MLPLALTDKMNHRSHGVIGVGVGEDVRLVSSAQLAQMSGSTVNDPVLSITPTRVRHTPQVHLELVITLCGAGTTNNVVSSVYGVGPTMSNFVPYTPCTRALVESTETMKPRAAAAPPAGANLPSRASVSGTP